MSKRKNDTKNKLDGNHKDVLINMIAAYFSNDEIIEYFKNEFGIKISSANISYYRKSGKWKNEIWEARKKFNNSICIDPVSQKTYRIRLRQKLIDDLFKEDHLWCIEETKYGFRYKGNHNHINSILDSIREELEPKKISLTDKDGKKDVTEKLEEIIEKGKLLAARYQHKHSSNSD